MLLDPSVCDHLDEVLIVVIGNEGEIATLRDVRVVDASKLFVE